MELDFRVNLINPCTFFFVNNPFLTLAQKFFEAFLKNRLKKLFSNFFVDGPLTSIA